MPYCFMNRGGSKGPDFPEGVGFLLLADCDATDWGLYEYQSDKEWSPQKPVSEGLAGLIDSGKRFPPVLALVRRDVEQRTFPSSIISPDELAAAITEALLNRLSIQSETSFVLACALQGELAYCIKGQWYWLLWLSRSNPSLVKWVSDDYFIYTTAAANFDLSQRQLLSLKRGDESAFHMKLDEMLWLDWDPIGVNENEQARDEYKGYLPHIVRLAVDGADAERIAGELMKFIDGMGLVADKTHNRMIAEKIIITRQIMLG